MAPVAATGPVTASGALLFDAAGRVLLVEPTYKPGFEFPGGMAQPGESPWETCVREVQEELGVTAPRPLRLLVADWASPGVGRVGGMRWLFDGGVMSPGQISSIRLPADELRSFVFVTVGAAADLLPRDRMRRLEAAMAVRRCGRAVYLHDGAKP